jgi:hypothetical protein
VTSAVTIQPPAVVYREEQYFDWRVYALIVFLELFTGLGLVGGRVWSLEFALGLLAGLAFVFLVVVFLLYMTTEVTPTDLRVWFGWVPTYRRIIPIGSVRSIEVVTYRPIADYGFWGIRSGRDGDKALTARGNRGVRLELTDGTRLLIGSQRPEQLARSLDSALRTGV